MTFGCSRTRLQASLAITRKVSASSPQFSAPQRFKRLIRRRCAVAWLCAAKILSFVCCRPARKLNATHVRQLVGFVIGNYELSEAGLEMKRYRVGRSGQAISNLSKIAYFLRVVMITSLAKPRTTAKHQTRYRANVNARGMPRIQLMLVFE